MWRAPARGLQSELFFASAKEQSCESSKPQRGVVAEPGDSGPTLGPCTSARACACAKTSAGTGTSPCSKAGPGSGSGTRPGSIANSDSDS